MAMNVSPRHVASLLGLLLTACGVDGAGGRADPQDLTTERVPRALLDKSTHGRLEAGAPIERLVIKFHEGTHVRLRDGRLTSARGLSNQRLRADLTEVQALLGGRVKSLFSQKEEHLETLKREGESSSGRELADLNLYFETSVARGATFADVAELIEQLNRYESVELAYAQPFAVPAQVDIPPTTASFELEQGYLDAAPIGVDARYAWTISGGNGNGVRVVDIEGGWRTTHEDMPPLFYQGGTQINLLDWRNHGTAVLGVIVGASNPYGVTGISPGASAGVEAVGAQSAASAITNAANAVGRGGVVLIELHAGGPAGTSCSCNLGQCGYVAMEYWSAEFDAIATASANGVIVVEASGNGSANLDDARYGTTFNRSVRDSGAILVAASNGAIRTPTCWTNHGSRIDAFGWGENVTTLGYGTRFNGGTEDQYYTGSFNGTSSASPVVVGSVVNLQGVVRAELRAPLAAWEMRNLISRTGTAQSGGTQMIGRMPNLRAAIDDLRRNLALGRPATQSSTTLGAVASRAVDGIRSGNWAAGSVTHTNLDANAWWQVDLGSVTDIGEVVIYNRTDCCGDRLADFDVRLSNDGVNYSTAATFGGVPPSRVALSIAASGRYVQIRLRGTNHLSLAEVEVRPPQNLALGRPATQSSTTLGADAFRATDGNRDGNFYANSVSHTNFDTNAFWQVDLGSIQEIARVAIFNRTDCCGDRLANFNLRVSNDGVSWTTVAGFTGTPPSRVDFALSTSGRFVQVRLQGANYLQLAEVEVYAPQNVAAGKNAIQSSTHSGASASRAVDGNTDGAFSGNSVTHTNFDTGAWWQVDLGAITSLRQLVVYNRTDCCGDRLANFEVLFSNDGINFSSAGAFIGVPPARTALTTGGPARYVRVRLLGTNYLQLAEVVVHRL